MNVVYKRRLVFCDYWDYMIKAEIAKYARLNLDFLCISFPFYLITRLKLETGHHIDLLKHLDS